jgi:hypothetical protein
MLDVLKNICPGSAEDGGTWLWFELAQEGGVEKFRWCCLACADQGPYYRSACHDAKPQISNLLYHHQSAKHKHCLALVLGDPSLEKAKAVDFDPSPPAKLFTDLLEAFGQGGSVQHGGIRLPSGVL